MYTTTILLPLLFTVAFGKHSIKPLYDLDKSLDYFLEFVKTYNKVYEEGEAAKRFQIFTGKLPDLNKFNEEHGQHLFRINEFLDITYEEFERTHFGFKGGNITLDEPPHYVFGNITPPDSFDWRDHNVFAPIKDQGNCGSCWAFSAVATMESQHAIKAKCPVVSLSEQQLVDCDRASSDDGCGGGYPDQAFNYAVKAGGMISESDYPYTASRGFCDFSNDKVAVKVKSGSKFASDEDEMKNILVNYGPFSIAMCASQQMMNAVGFTGVLDPTDCFEELTHAVIIVGYGEEDGTPYWIIRNSWGTKWGDQGYIKFIRDEAACQIGAYVATAEVA